MTANPNTVRETLTEEQEQQWGETLLDVAYMSDIMGIRQVLKAGVDVNKATENGDAPPRRLALKF